MLLRDAFSFKTNWYGPILVLLTLTISVKREILELTFREKGDGYYSRFVLATTMKKSPTRGKSRQHEGHQFYYSQNGDNWLTFDLFPNIGQLDVKNQS